MRPTWQSRGRAAGIGITLAAAAAFVFAAHWFQQPSLPSEAQSQQSSGLTRSAAPGPRTPGPVQQAYSNLIVPVARVRPDDLVDTFSQARANGGRQHDAIDILAPRGTPVIAAASGTVEKLFLSKDGGNTVYVRSPDGQTLYYYAHLDGYAPGLTERTRIEQGAPIGTVGSTGNANPAVPHLHFAIWTTTPERKWWEDALALNPYPLLARPTEQIGAR
ncbi:M23 family metallopeptidase [Novosphingobium sp. G106]|uniref:M23 family metallopeptidase n=1 Tax=Novosphingobium sp. G106 TaxID=2849500 RepID=UPI001C2D90D7|nr:M23 family metallopeptidase [Novosphingobium sp. G106]